MQNLNIILCVDANNTIDISWKIKEDLQYFKKMTLDNIIIMGRKTADTFLAPLKNRLNIVITKEKNYRNDEGFINFSHLQLALDTLYETNKKIFIIGGLQLFDETIKYKPNIFMNKINKSYIGNKLFLSNTFLHNLQTYSILTQEHKEAYCLTLNENIILAITHYIYK